MTKQQMERAFAGAVELLRSEGAESSWIPAGTGTLYLRVWLGDRRQATHAASVELRAGDHDAAFFRRNAPSKYIDETSCNFSAESLVAKVKAV